MANTATLAGTDLPQHFSYKPYVPKKRTSTTPTAGAVVVQAASPVIIHGEGSIGWTCNSCYPSEFQVFWNLFYTVGNVDYLFTGYWGEQFTVKFSILDEPQVRGRLFDCSGQFQVIEVIQAYNAVCKP